MLGREKYLLGGSRKTCHASNTHTSSLSLLAALPPCCCAFSAPSRMRRRRWRASRGIAVRWRRLRAPAPRAAAACRKAAARHAASLRGRRRTCGTAPQSTRSIKTKKALYGCCAELHVSLSGGRTAPRAAGRRATRDARRETAPASRVLPFACVFQAWRFAGVASARISARRACCGAARRRLANALYSAGGAKTRWAPLGRRTTSGAWTTPSHAALSRVSSRTGHEPEHSISAVDARRGRRAPLDACRLTRHRGLLCTYPAPRLCLPAFYSSLPVLKPPGVFTATCRLEHQKTATALYLPARTFHVCSS